MLDLDECTGDPPTHVKGSLRVVTLGTFSGTGV